MTRVGTSPEMSSSGGAAENRLPRRFRVLMVAPTSFFSDYGGHIRILEEAYTLQELDQEVAIVTYYKGSDMPGLDIRRTAPLPPRHRTATVGPTPGLHELPLRRRWPGRCWAWPARQ